MNQEQTLIDNTIKGNTSSFSVIVEIYQEQIFNFINKYILSKQDSEEICQEVFIRAFYNLKKYNSRWSFSSWLHTIAINTIKNHFRKMKNTPKRVYNNETMNNIPSSKNNPEIDYESKIERSIIINLISELNDNQKNAFILRYLQGFSYDEIGKILCTSTSAAKMKVQRAKKRLFKKYLKYKKEQ